MTRDEAIESLRDRTPGSDPADPYADVDPASLPEWWRSAIEEFAAHELRPYRPPRFADGTYVHEIRTHLESELDVEIDFGATGSAYRDRWSARIDGEPAFELPRYRSADGFTVYDIESSTFADRIRTAVE